MVTKTMSKNGKYLGRPTKYDPALCEKIPRLGKLGKSRWQIASELGITPSNLENWEAVHEDFRDALRQARLDALAYWEGLAEAHIIETPGSPKLNTGLWSRSMAARFPNEYRENNKVELTGANNGPVQVDVVHDLALDLVSDLLAMRQKESDDK